MKKYRIKPEMEPKLIKAILLLAICISLSACDLLLDLIFIAFGLTFVATLYILPIQLILLLFKSKRMNKKILGRTALICLVTFICTAALMDKVDTTTTDETAIETATETDTEKIKENNTSEFDINDVEIEFTEKNTAIITNNSKYDTTRILFIYKENDCILGTTYSLKPGDSQTISDQNYVRDGGYELVKIQIQYIDESGNEKFIEYDAVLDRYQSFS